ncbi:MAG: hypothetical protein JW913_18485 [Chitinispirillaceae bacterium]|nr:hypothetical protein [Chitinispirillaceae bacterium]
MPRFPLYSSLILLFPLSPSFSQTAVSGDIHEYLFNAAGSPYFVEKDIIVPSETECTIEGGCVFLFRPFTGLIVEGTLLVNGTPEQPVVFTSVNDTAYSRGGGQSANPFDWNGVVVAAESHGSSFSNLHVGYSVYGIKSQTPNLIVDRCIFFQNGQFHFTVKDKIHDVREGISFSYPAVKTPEAPKVEQPIAAPTQVEKQPAAPPKLSPPVRQKPLLGRKRLVIRYGSLGIGIVGIVGGAVCSALASNDRKDIESMDPHTVNPATGSYYERNDEAVVTAHDSFSRDKAGAIAGFIVGTLGLAGFGVTFLF